MLRHSGVDRRLVVHAIADDALDDALDLGQKRRYVRGVLCMALRHRGRDNLPLGIDAEVQCLPAFLRLLAMFLGMPCAWATDLQAAAVHDQGE
jgi:hypothetical protein